MSRLGLRRFDGILIITLFLSPGAVSDEVDIGSLISRCAECHTEQGAAGIPGWPSIAGMNKQVIIGKLKGHRAGLIDDSTMKKVAHDLTDTEIEAVAKHFSTLLPEH